MKSEIEQIRKAMADLAVIIEKSPDGYKCWPIFERLENELAKRESRAERLALAKNW